MELRNDLPPLPDRLTRLPIDHRGYPVPWFVAWLDPEEKPLPRGQGKPDFRVVMAGAFRQAVVENRCWLCGQHLGKYKTFVAGPMCGVNKTSGEPPCHLDCATFAATACPFLTRPKAKRREANLPEGEFADGGITRNPGIAMVWTTTTYRVINNGESKLVRMGFPDHIEWFAEGEIATHDKVMESIESGIPLLKEQCETDEELGEVDVLVADFIVDWVPK